ncbi:hypothetical protein ABID82_006938 [Methylobacterium sp. PvP062]|jgi:hypothetical protein|uniref:Restriction endonuclease type IV Mrr domain-containing protein n=1 Tax=Methylobacterium radiotolerans TaxID=31998 RepID=A0ABV2N8A3_9HYPH|nr:MULTISPECIES: hypothetical protein [unclassified Methylobacterium]MBP2498233.1 hypothetical protein [Methylobacterium sp. PvP105]MBP2506368.1 hypothetical protein [Methylobacterium sp. PvP109]
MSDQSTLPKGAVLEEVLRAYFLRAGFFVIRGVPFRFADEDLTDVDLWLYERPTGTSRRVQICDIKYKQRPKAVERLFWTKGLAEALNVDAAYVATTDKRRNLRSVADKLSLQLIDGTDIQRIHNSPSIVYVDGISDEDMIRELQSVDKEFRNKELSEARIDILSSLSEGFGAPSTVRSLEGFARLARLAVSYHPDSSAARAAGRLAYLAAAIACESLDYVSVGAAFRTIEEKRELILGAVRLGALSNEDRHQTLRLALGLVERYAPGGRATAAAVEAALKKELDRIPAEIVADQCVRLLKADQLFFVGRELEMTAYKANLPNFDHLSTQTKSMLGALLDYSHVDRERFAKSWDFKSSSKTSDDVRELIAEDQNKERNLFSD